MIGILSPAAFLPRNKRRRRRKAAESDSESQCAPFPVPRHGFRQTMNQSWNSNREFPPDNRSTRLPKPYPDVIRSTHLDFCFRRSLFYPDQIRRHLSIVFLPFLGCILVLQAADFFYLNPRASKLFSLFSPIWFRMVAALWIALACCLLVFFKDILRFLGLMGGKSSREDNGRRSFGGGGGGGGGGGYPAAPAPWPDARSSQAPYSAPTTSLPSHQPRTTRKLDRKYSRIADDYNSLDEVTEALARAGLESSNLIVGVDFTKSNEWTGKISFNRQSLHRIGETPNPYEQAISIIGRTLTAFDEDNCIPCYGFGDASTHDQDVFSFYPNDQPCNGFEEALSRYREIAPQLRLAGPTSFAPIIEMAMTIVEQSGGQYHVLLIIADGQVTRSVDIMAGQLSAQEQNTVDAIVKASEFPLSIILVGVGDGPWDMMKEFDDNIPARAFDNFQFVNFTEIMSKRVSQSRKETEFALSALMEIPLQYRATLELGILGQPSGKNPARISLPPPVGGYTSTSASSKPYAKPTGFKQSAPSYPSFDAAAPSSAPPLNTASSWDNLVCPICLTNSKDMAFGCGHQTCCECGQSLQNCPICRGEIVTRIKLYS